MKKILSLLIGVTLLYSLHAQVLYTTASGGGVNRGGTISKLDAATSTLSAAFSFAAADLTAPSRSSLVQASDGKLYGVTPVGGTYNLGGIFSFTPSTGIYTRLKDFDGANGSHSNGSLVQAKDGKLYGMTEEGGTNGVGVIFSFDPATSVFTILKDFDGTNGSNPRGSLVQATDSKLYGMTTKGGNNDLGVIFSLNPAIGVYTKLKDFTGTNGANPEGSLIQATDGKLYGLTALGGGTNNGGVIFSFNPATNAFAKLRDFAGGDGTLDDGRFPDGNFVQATDGKLYGMTAQGGSTDDGTIFSFDPATLTYTRLTDFNGGDGEVPRGSLVQAANGKLYGLTSTGGGSGNLFSFDPANLVLTNLTNFIGSNGRYPNGSLVQAKDGKLYGMTSSGGSAELGVVFSFDPTNSAEVKLKDFGTNTTGNSPYSGAIIGANGRLYGMTLRGGAYGLGTLYSFDPATSVFSKLKDFDGTNGSHPYGSLVQAKDGKLYGITEEGGTNGVGVIFSFDPATSVFTKLKDFDGTNGGNPYGSLVQASNSKLYGMTNSGGKNGLGVIFFFDPATAIYTKLQSFTGTNGSSPYGSFVQARDGKLYGMTAYGGTKGMGVIFSLNPTTGGSTKLKDFIGTDGSTPESNLVEASDGKLYGLTAYGGNSNAGVIFSFTPATSTFTKLRDFDGTNGAVPDGSLAQATDGKLYGVTSHGGNGYNGGVAFSFNPVNLVYSKLADFTGSNGEIPVYTIFTQASNCNTVYYKDADNDGYGDASTHTTACSQPNGYVSDSSDCNDADSTIHPGAPEISDGKDNDCNGIVDDTPPNVKISDAALTEGNTGTKFFTFKVTLSGTSSQPVTVSYTTKNGTAAAPSDYDARSSTITFGPGIKKRYVDIKVKGDTQVESDEIFNVVLTSAVNATITDSIAVGTILNDDGSAPAILAKQGDGSNYQSAVTASAITVLPNPASSLMQVQLSGYSGKVWLRLTDLQGKLLKEAVVSMNQAKRSQQQFPVADMASGTYFLIAVDEKGNKQSVKVVVVH